MKMIKHLVPLNIQRRSRTVFNNSKQNIKFVICILNFLYDLEIYIDDLAISQSKNQAAFTRREINQSNEV